VDRVSLQRIGLLLALHLTGWGLAARPARAAEARSDPTAALARARSLMAAGDDEGAVAAAASAVAQQPGNGSAYLVLGMAHFRGGRYQDALAAFHSARQAPQPPAAGPLAFNEGSTLFALARFADAERAFEEAASRDGRLGPLAALNAGQAALAGGNLARARAHLLAAEQQPGAAALSAELGELRAELERRETAEQVVKAEALRSRAREALKAGRLHEAIAGYQAARAEARRRNAPPSERADLAYAEGVGSLRAGLGAQAVALFREAWALEPRVADHPYMLGLAALQIDDPATARGSLEQALALGLDEPDAAAARAALDRLSLGMRRAGAGLSLSFEVGAGYDSNVSQLSAGRVEGLSGEAPETPGGAAGSLSLEVAAGRSFGRLFFGEVAYWLAQHAYASESLDLYNLQSHQLAARGELTPRGPLRLGLAVEAEYQLAGLRGFAYFQRALAVEPQIALDESPHTATVLRLHGRLQDATAEEDHLDGRRLQLTLGQIWRSRRLRGGITLRHRREQIGTRSVDLSGLGRRERFEGRYQVPYGHRANALLVDASVSLGTRLRLGADASIERLRYMQDNVLVVTGPLGRTTEAGRVRREDRRLVAGTQLGLALTETIDTTLRYDLVVNRSTVELAFDDKNYRKHTVMLTLGLAF
jgi:tetratricopeptide (TPR) repeat protein